MIFIHSTEDTFIDNCKSTLIDHNIQFIDQVQDHHFDMEENKDLFILDINSINMSKIPKVNCPAIALSAVPKYDEAMIMLHQGFRGYGNKYMLSDNLHQAIQTVTTGQVWLPPNILTRMISMLPQSESVNTSSPCHIKELTTKEAEVAKMVAKGLSNKEISTEMNITIRTVKSHLTSIFNKTGYRDRLELAINIK